MKAVVKELRGSFPTLLRSKRAGVVSAALAAAVRTSTGQLDLSKALSAALRDLPGNQQVIPPYSGQPLKAPLRFPPSFLPQGCTDCPYVLDFRYWSDLLRQTLLHHCIE